MNLSRDRGLRRKVFDAVRAYFDFRHAPRPFIPGSTYIPASGKVFDFKELQALTDASLDFWLTADRYAAEFERRFTRRLKTCRTLLVNSGSSANLLAMSALADPSLGKQRFKPGDEVVTTAACFPTTVAPITQQGLIPVLVDVDIPTYNVSPATLEAAISPKTKAIVLAHTHSAILSTPRPYPASPPAAGSGLSRTAATPSARVGRIGPSRASGTSPHSAFTPPTTSPWARAGPC